MDKIMKLDLTKIGKRFYFSRLASLKLLLQVIIISLKTCTHIVCTYFICKYIFIKKETKTCPILRPTPLIILAQVLQAAINDLAKKLTARETFKQSLLK